MKETRHERVHIVLFPLHEMLEQSYSIVTYLSLLLFGYRKSLQSLQAKCQLRLVSPLRVIEVGLLLSSLMCLLAELSSH